MRYDSSCSYICAFCKLYTDEHVSLKCRLCYRGSRSSNECFRNISLMDILVNNDFNHVQQVQWEERPGLCSVLGH